MFCCLSYVLFFVSLFYCFVVFWRSFCCKKPNWGPIVCSGRSASHGSGLRGIGALFRDPTNLRWEQRAKKHVKILTRPSAAHACTGRFSGVTLWVLNREGWQKCETHFTHRGARIRCRVVVDFQFALLFFSSLGHASDPRRAKFRGSWGPVPVLFPLFRI